MSELVTRDVSADVCSLTEERARPPGDVTRENLVGILGIASQTLNQPKYYTYEISI